MKISWTVKGIEWARFLSQKLLLTKFTKAVTKTMCVQELWFLHSACWPMLVNIYMKTQENISNILKLNIRHNLVTKTATFKVQRGITIKYISTSYGSCTMQVVLLCLIFLWISWKHLEQFWCYIADRILSQKLFTRFKRGVNEKIY